MLKYLILNTHFPITHIDFNSVRKANTFGIFPIEISDRQYITHYLTGSFKKDLPLKIQRKELKTNISPFFIRQLEFFEKKKKKEIAFLLKSV